MALTVTACPRLPMPPFSGGDVATWRAIHATNLAQTIRAQRTNAKMGRLLQAGRQGLEAARLLALAVGGKAIPGRVIARAIARALRPAGDPFQAVSAELVEVVAIVAQIVYAVAILGHCGPPQARPASPRAPNPNP